MLQILSITVLFLVTDLASNGQPAVTERSVSRSLCLCQTSQSVLADETTPAHHHHHYHRGVGRCSAHLIPCCGSEHGGFRRAVRGVLDFPRMAHHVHGVPPWLGVSGAMSHSSRVPLRSRTQALRSLPHCCGCARTTSPPHAYTQASETRHHCCLSG